MMRNEAANDLAGRLEGFRLFAGMSRAEVSEVVLRIGCGSRRHAKGGVIVHEGVEPKWMYAVLSGVVFHEMSNLGHTSRADFEKI